MKIPFYQREWLGVDLVDIAHAIGHDVSQVADTRFYNELYKRLFSEGNFDPDQAWLINKRHLSSWIQAFLTRTAKKNAKILSVGCGLVLLSCP